VTARQGTTLFRSFLLGIPAQIEELGPFEMVFPYEPERHQIMLLEAMGVPVVVDRKVRVPVVRRRTQP
jgi:hypothetical protein